MMVDGLIIFDGAEEFERIQQAAALMMFLSPGTTTGLAYEVQGTPVVDF